MEKGPPGKGLAGKGRLAVLDTRLMPIGSLGTGRHGKMGGCGNAAADEAPKKGWHSLCKKK